MRIRRGFSLVEVLMAVLVLAIGLLGLGAVFPMIVRQQRIATHETMGLSAREGVRQFLVNHEDFRPGGPAWDLLRTELINETTDGEWWSVPLDRATSNMYLPVDTNDQVVLPLSQRLYPLPVVSEAQPRFVWDIAARLVNPDIDPANSALLVAVFLRPIDPGIRPPVNGSTGKPYSLTTTLVDPRDVLAGRDQRLPISATRDGRPTLDGSKDRGALYSLPIVGDVSLPGTNPDLNQMSFDQVRSGNADDEVAAELLAAVGQRFLDRRGYLYEVKRVRVLGNSRTLIEIDPPFPDPDGDGVVDEDLEINPIIFVPQGSAIEPILLQVQP